ncbi:MAG: hypothetical protein PHI88_00115 [Candidatus Pacebacteria bacterium]|nr:hypothetical protein [Candidatus Paceibacterota bacterium]
MQIKKKIFIITGLILIILSILSFSFFYKKEKAPEGLIFTQSFKDGLDPLNSEEKYINIFKKAQNLTDLPIKYPIKLPKEYKLFKVNLWRGEKTPEKIEIYYDVNNESLSEKNTKFIKKGGKSYSDHGLIVLNKDKKTILIEGTIIKPYFLENNFYLPKNQLEEKTLINGKKAILFKYNQIDESTRDIEYSYTIYLGYAKRDEKTYYYLISSNAPENTILEAANFIIKNEKER